MFLKRRKSQVWYKYPNVKVFFEWRGPATSSTEDGRVNISEQGNLSTATIIPLSLQVAQYVHTLVHV